eukprot:s6883_g4.t1
MLSPPTSRSDGSNVREPALPRSTNCSPSVPSAAAMAEPGMPQSGRSTPAAPNANVIAEVSVSVAEVVAAAADAAGPPQPAQGWPPAQAMNSWPSLAETQQDPWPSQVSTSPWPAAEAPGRAFDAPNMTQSCLELYRMVVKLQISGHDEVDGVMWYDIEVTNEVCWKFFLRPPCGTGERS